MAQTHKLRATQTSLLFTRQVSFAYKFALIPTGFYTIYDDRSHTLFSPNNNN